MKPCTVSHEALNSYVDGELALPAENDLRRHLDICRSCQATVKALLALKGVIAAGADVRPVPHTLRERAGALAPPRSGRWARLPASALAAAAVLLIVIGVHYYWPTHSADPLDRVVSALAADHIHFQQVEAPAEISSRDPDVVAAWFSGRLEFPVRFPRFGAADLVGGRLCSLWGHKVALAFYEAHGKRLSLFVLNRASLASQARGISACRGAMAGYEVCLHPSADTVLALVGEKDQLAPLLPELQSFGSPQH